MRLSCAPIDRERRSRDAEAQTTWLSALNILERRRNIASFAAMTAQ